MKDSAHLRGFGRLPTLLIAQGVKSPDAFRFGSFVEKLIRTRGPKGAMLYLDSLSNHVSKQLLGWAPATSNPTWVRRSNVAFLRRTKNKHLLRRLTKIKRLITIDKPSPEQVKKFVDSVLRGQPDEVALFTASHLCQRGASLLSRFYPKNRSQKPDNAFLAYTKRELSRGLSPDEARLRACSKIQNDLVVLDKLGYFGDFEVANLIYKALEPLNRIEVDRLRTAAPLGTPPKHLDTIGVICASQEPGMKLRVFASPILLTQCILEPLKSSLMATLRAIDNDGCFRQATIVDIILDWMKDGCVKFSLDLQNATDRFPAILEYITLQAIHGVDTTQLRLFRYVSSEEWRIHEDLVPYFGMDKIKWSVGQPLGTGPSFGAFSLAHHALVRGLCAQEGVSEDAYVILGDDICIRDARLAHAYRALLERLGVPISESKSVVSATLAEFAGYTISKSDAFRPGKWREVTSESLLSFISDPGYDYKLVVPKYWVPLIERMKNSPYPYGMGVPDLLSMSIEDRYFYAVDIFEHFASNLMPSPTAHHDGDILTDDRQLLKSIFSQTEIINKIYQGQNDAEHESRNQRMLESDRQQARIRTLFTVRDPGKTFNPEGSFGRTNWMQLSWMHRAPSTIRDQPNPYGRVRRVASSIPRLQEAMSLLSPDVAEAIESLGSFILSYVTSYNDRTLAQCGGTTNFITMWIQSVPILEQYYQNQVLEPTVLDVIRDAISMFPYYHLSDFSAAPTRFISLIRRYGQGKELLPSLRPPMPHLRKLS